MSDNNYCIVVVKNMYQPDLAGEGAPHIMTEPWSTEPVLFDTVDEARGKIKELDDDTYVTSNNEAGRPDYYILDYHKAQTYFDDGNDKYSWDSCDCQNGDDDEPCGECQNCFRYMRDMDEEWVKIHSISG
jgi:hypothetical protein